MTLPPVNLHSRPEPGGPIPCPHPCSGVSCELLPAGPARLPQSGDSYLPAIRYERADCPIRAVVILATGEPWRARA